MREELYKTFKLDSNATDEEIDAQYAKLREEYRNDMFLEGEKGNIAAKKLTELENAYADVLSERSYKSEEFISENKDDDALKYNKVESLVKDGKLNEAQAILDDISDRGAQWHYYQAMVFYKEDWFTDSKKQLELALELDGNNERYKTALARLEKVMNGESNKKEEKKEKPAEEWWKEQQEHMDDSEGPNWDANNRQMGACYETMDCCTQLICINLLCNCLGGGC